jgi:hypoxanthine phosphoribosyltransferase
MRTRTFLSYETMAQWVESLGPELRAAGFVAVAAIVRGGVFPGLWASYATGLPLHCLQYDRARGQARWIGEAPPPGRLLLCEDVAGMGETLVECLRFANATHPDCEVLTLVSDELSRVRPRWSRFAPNVQTIFPWERHDQTPAFQRDWQGGGSTGASAMRPDHDYRLWAVDLDGVLCDDMPAGRYGADLARCLAERDDLPLHPRAPALLAHTHVIVTGRPAHDGERTRRWLARHGLHGIAVHHRDPGLHDDSLEAAARYKGSTADRLGCSDFIESCPHQAALVALQRPHLRVYWWADGHPVLLSATAAPLHGGG